MTRDLYIFLFGVLWGLAIFFLTLAIYDSPDKGFPSRSLLDALAFVESSNNPRAISSAGACGLHQIMRSTWEDMTEEPWSECTDPEANQRVAIKYLEWLNTTLGSWMGKEPTDADILACWNGGIGRFKRRGYDLEKMPVETRNFVRKVAEHIRT